MSSEFKSFCLLCASNSQVLDLSDMEFDLLVRPALGFHHEDCQTSRPEDHKLNDPKQEERQRCREEDLEKKISLPAGASLEIRIPSRKDVEVEGDDNPNDDGFKTPTSSDHRIPVILQCPPAPRKPKPVPSKKRKACRSRIVLDLSIEIESLFPTPILVDLGSNNIKKVKQGRN